jgi:hypothetical protein
MLIRIVRRAWLRASVLAACGKDSCAERCHQDCKAGTRSQPCARQPRWRGETAMTCTTMRLRCFYTHITNNTDTDTSIW